MLRVCAVVACILVTMRAELAWARVWLLLLILAPAW